MTSTPPALTTDDESAVRALVSEFANTWNRHDMQAMHELDTEDVEWINITGNDWRGKAAVYKGHDTIHRTIFAKTSMTVQETAIRPIAPNVAVAVATMTFGPVITPTGQNVPEIDKRLIHNGETRGHLEDRALPEHHCGSRSGENDPITWDESGYLPGGKGSDNLDESRKKP